MASAATGAWAGPRRSRYAAECLVALALSGLFAWWLTSPYGDPFHRKYVSDLAFILAPLLACWACWDAGRRGDSWCAGWRWLAVGCLVWTGASVVWAVYEIGLRVYAPFPSAADIGYIGYSIPMVVGLSLFPALRNNPLSKLRVGLDTTAIIVALLFTSGLLVLDPVWVGTGGHLLARVDALGYPAADLLIASVLLTRHSMFANPTRFFAWLLLASGLLLLAWTDSTYVARTFAHTYHSGYLLDLGWVASFLLIALAARLPAPVDEGPAATEQAPNALQHLLPYAALAVAAYGMLRHPDLFLGGGRFHWVLFVLGGLFVVRQVVVSMDQASITRNLGRAVARRTHELFRREQWWMELVRNLSDVILVVDPSGTLRYCSPSAYRALGHVPSEDTAAAQLMTFLHPDDVEGAVGALSPLLSGQRGDVLLECRLRRADGTFGWFEIRGVSDLEGAVLEGAVLTLRDVSEQRELTDRLVHQAYHDSLTGLPNRAMLAQRIDQALPCRLREPFALLLIDLDDFKLINDSHGHPSGDVVLKAIGERLRASVRGSDTVARLGGDEFAVLVKGGTRVVRDLAERLRSRIEEPVTADGRRFHVRASVGVVFAALDEEESSESLLAHADMALYEAKAHQRGRVVLIDGSERELIAGQVYLREQIARPQLDEFSVVYQPIVELQSGRVRGVEALLRWRHPELGDIPPAEFIPLAEHGGSISQLGRFVLETACRQLSEWSRRVPHHRLAIGVNISILQLEEPGFAEAVTRTIEQYAISPDQLVLELTEQALVRDFETAASVVAALRAAGVSVAVDDFGTGYSSLRYLHRFAADVMKIDRSFVANLGDSEHTRKIVWSVLQMAGSLDLQSIAEGVETESQADLLRSLGCELAQGYLFSRPITPGQVSELLDRGGYLLPAQGRAAVLA